LANVFWLALGVEQQIAHLVGGRCPRHRRCSRRSRYCNDRQCHCRRVDRSVLRKGQPVRQHLLRQCAEQAGDHPAGKAGVLETAGPAQGRCQRRCRRHRGQKPVRRVPEAGKIAGGEAVLGLGQQRRRILVDGGDGTARQRQGPGRQPVEQHLFGDVAHLFVKLFAPCGTQNIDAKIAFVNIHAVSGLPGAACLDREARTARNTLQQQQRILALEEALRFGNVAKTPDAVIGNRVGKGRDALVLCQSGKPVPVGQRRYRAFDHDGNGGVIGLGQTRPQSGGQFQSRGGIAIGNRLAFLDLVEKAHDEIHGRQQTVGQFGIYADVMVPDPVQQILGRMDQARQHRQIEQTGIALERMDQPENIADQHIVVGEFLEGQQFLADLVGKITALGQKLLQQRIHFASPAISAAAHSRRSGLLGLAM